MPTNNPIISLSPGAAPYVMAPLFAVAAHAGAHRSHVAAELEHQRGDLIALHATAMQQLVILRAALASEQERSRILEEAARELGQQVLELREDLRRRRGEERGIHAQIDAGAAAPADVIRMGIADLWISVDALEGRDGDDVSTTLDRVIGTLRQLADAAPWAAEEDGEERRVALRGLYIARP